MSLARQCRHRAPLENYVPHTMAQAESTLLELRLWAIIRSRREALYNVSEHWLRTEDVEHLLSVFLPVGGKMEVSAWLQP